jgi:hypothetical protein
MKFLECFIMSQSKCIFNGIISIHKIDGVDLKIISRIPSFK